MPRRARERRAGEQGAHRFAQATQNTSLIPRSRKNASCNSVEVVATFVGFAMHAPQRQIDTPTLGQQCRRAGDNAIDAVKGKSHVSAEDERVSRGQAKRSGGVSAPCATDAKDTGVAER